MFSQTVEYALRAMVFLAQRPNDAHTTDSIAETTKVPRSYLPKILQSLARANLIRSHRGVYGGITLDQPPETITVYAVVEAVDPIQRIATCPLGLASHGVRLCPLHRRMDDALASVEAALRATTLAEIISEPTESVPLCDFPPRAGTISLPTRTIPAEGESG